MSRVRLLGLDPGTNNFAYTVLSLDTETPQHVEVVAHGMLHDTIRTLTTPSRLRAERVAFESGLDLIVSSHNITHVCAERYMLRRGQGGTAIECIGMMLGILLARGLPTKVIPASQWKNAYHAVHDPLEHLYAEVKDSGIAVHQVDSCHIGLYGVQNLCGVKYSSWPDVIGDMVSVGSTDIGTPFRRPKKKKKKRRVSS